MHKQRCLAIFTMITFSVACTQAPQKARDFELSDLDTTAYPTNDFDAYANGGWKKNNPLPGEKSRYGTFDKLDDQAQEQVKVLFSGICLNSILLFRLDKEIRCICPGVREL